jgi:hypothetical protein
LSNSAKKISGNIARDVHLCLRYRKHVREEKRGSLPNFMVVVRKLGWLKVKFTDETTSFTLEDHPSNMMQWKSMIYSVIY